MAFIFIIGFLAQGFFSARILVQWILSEKQHRIVSPALFWIFSVAGSYLFFIYGWLRSDFSIILGQLISYYIYLWNLNLKGLWHNMHRLFRYILLLTPIVAICWVSGHFGSFINSFFHNDEVPLPLLVFGSAGQVLFTLRFIYQWYYSNHLKRSELPIGFWVISLIGSGTIIAYAIFRLDPVLIIGQSVGFIAYSRNIVIGSRKKQEL